MLRYLLAERALFKQQIAFFLKRKKEDIHLFEKMFNL